MNAPIPTARITAAPMRYLGQLSSTPVGVVLPVGAGVAASVGLGVVLGFSWLEKSQESCFSVPSFLYATTMVSSPFSPLNTLTTTR